MEIIKKHKDNDIVVISKPPGIETAELEHIGLPAHRLDRDTSGLIILARNEKALNPLQKQFKNREVKKKYLSLVLGETPKKGMIKGYLCRDPSRKKPFVFSSLGIGKERGRWRDSKSNYKRLKTYQTGDKTLSLLEVAISTGRTHQIRIHLRHEGFPILGDKVYNIKKSRQLSKQLEIPRQFLHASSLAFKHPITGKKMEFKDKLPQDLKKILNQLK